MVVSANMASSAQGGEIGGLALSCVQVDNPMAVLRAAHWRNALSKVGLPVPFWAVHDLGSLASAEAAGSPIGMRKSLAQVPLAAHSKQALEVWTETLRELADSEVMERSRGWRLTDDLISVRIGDGYAGWPEEAPFDSIVVTAAAPRVPPALVAQLKPGGRMVIPVGESGAAQELLVITKRADGGIDTRSVLPVRFGPLVPGK